MLNSSYTLWRLRPGADRRFRSGHPWVYSNELAESPKALAPGAPVELRDASGKFLARGYGNPASLISFRALSRNPEEADPLSQEGLLSRLAQAGKVREALGMFDASFRLSYGEADHLPGLIIDRYLLESGKTAQQIFAIQAHTAGMDRVLPLVEKALEEYCSKTDDMPSWENTGVVIRNDLGVRTMEGLEEQTPRVAKTLARLDFNQAKIRVRSGDQILSMIVDLIGGQKTGFFLDQSANIQLAALRLRGLKPAQQTVKILDLCSYVGQWSVQLARVYIDQGFKVEVTAVDASAKALEFAKKNIEAQGAKCETLKADVLRNLTTLPDGLFDLVISDPPALIKSRKDVGPGTHAYLQLNTQVFRLVRSGGAVVCCSCSALLEEEEFLKTLSKAASRNSMEVRWIGRGCQAPDHPMLAEFPEGRYLKAWIGITKKGVNLSKESKNGEKDN